MPKLKFLDAKQVDKNELLLSLQHSRNGHQSNHTVLDQPEASMEKLGSLKKFLGLQPKEPGAGSSTPAYNPLPIDTQDTTQPSPKSVYGKVKNRYEGSQSQGNRFILNKDL